VIRRWEYAIGRVHWKIEIDQLRTVLSLSACRFDVRGSRDWRSASCVVSAGREWVTNPVCAVTPPILPLVLSSPCAASSRPHDCRTPLDAGATFYFRIVARTSTEIFRLDTGSGACEITSGLSGCSTIVIRWLSDDPPVGWPICITANPP
jgi:hypothetical protein